MRFTTAIRMAMAAMAEKKVKKAAHNASIGNGVSSASAPRPLKRPAAAIAGMPSRNEKRAASSRRKPMKRAAVIVMPERDVPGMSATACARPMTSAEGSRMSSIALMRGPTTSAT